MNPVAIMGARAYYVTFEWDYFKNQPWWNIFIFFILIFFRRHKKRDGNFRVAQIISVVLILIGATLIIYKRYIEKYKAYNI